MISYTCPIPQTVDFNHLLDIMDICDATMAPVKVETCVIVEHTVEFTFSDEDGYKLFLQNYKSLIGEE